MSLTLRTGTTYQTQVRRDKIMNPSSFFIYCWFEHTFLCVCVLAAQGWHPNVFEIVKPTMKMNNR